MSAALATASPTADRLSPHKFAKLAALIYDQTGIKMPRTKSTMLEGRLQRRLRDTGMATLDQYCDHLFDGRAAEGELDRAQLDAALAGRLPPIEDLPDGEVAP